MRLARPTLCDKVVYTVIPYQGNTVSFAAHVRNMTQFLAREKLRSRLYTKYEALMMTLETLQGRFRAQMKHKDGLLFETGHDKVDAIPFKLAMSNLATTLTSWAKELNLDIPRGSKGDRVNHLGSHQDMGTADTGGDVNFVGSDRQCKFCNIPGHTTDDCQLFINFLMASRFAKQNPDLVATTLKKHSTFMCIRPTGRGRPVNNIDVSPGSEDSDLAQEETTPEGGQVIQFDEDGLICHLTDDSALYQYASDNESLHSCPFAAPIVHIEEYGHSFVPDIDDYLVVHVGEASPGGLSYEDVATAIETAHTAPAVNWESTFNLPLTSTCSASGNPQFM
jgi:hypothetical protein